MKKPKLYLDTSVISYLDQQDAPEKMMKTRLFWERLKSGEFDICLSRVTLTELERCTEPKRALLAAYLNEITYQFTDITDEIKSIAEKFIENRILTQKSLDDCRHIAASIVLQCDMIVSWNFKHLVNYRTIQGVKLVSVLTGYKEVAIYTPEVFVAGDGEGEDDET